MERKILHRFGLNIKQLRNEKSWSQEDLAKRCGLHRTYIGSLERGERNISLLNIAKIADAFDIDIKELL